MFDFGLKKRKKKLVIFMIRPIFYFRFYILINVKMYYYARLQQNQDCFN